jgi:hypothetical protein
VASHPRTREKERDGEALPEQCSNRVVQHGQVMSLTQCREPGEGGLCGWRVGAANQTKEGNMSEAFTVGAVLNRRALAEWRRENTPSIEQLMRWESEGGCEAAGPCGCWVEPDGRCEHGHPSWLRFLGFI